MFHLHVELKWLSPLRYQAMYSYTARGTAESYSEWGLMSVPRQNYWLNNGLCQLYLSKAGKNKYLVLLLKKKKKSTGCLSGELWSEKVKRSFRSCHSLGRRTPKWEQRTILCSAGKGFLAPFMPVLGREWHSSAFSSILQCWDKCWAPTVLNFCWNWDVSPFRKLPPHFCDGLKGIEYMYFPVCNWKMSGYRNGR